MKIKIGKASIDTKTQSYMRLLLSCFTAHLVQPEYPQGAPFQAVSTVP